MTTQVRTVLGMILVLALSLVTAACGASHAAAPLKPAASPSAPSKPAASRSASSEPAAMTHVSLVTSYLISGIDAPFWVGVHRGFYKQEHLIVSLQPGAATFTSLQQVANGAMTFGQLDGGTVMTGVSQGLSLLGVGQLQTTEPYAVLAPIGSGIRTIQDLKGKKLGDGPADATTQLLPAVLAYRHMTEKDLHMVNMVNTALIPAFLAHRVDAELGLTIGQMPAIESKGLKLRAILYSENGLNMPGFGIYTNKAYAAAHPGVVKRFNLATRLAMEWTEQHPKQSAAILQKNFPKYKLTLLLKQLQLSLPLFANPPVGPFSFKQYKTAEQQLFKYHVLKKPVDVTKIITNKYVPN